MTARVFAPHLPTRRDPITGEVTPAMDLTPAREWGEVITLLRPSQNPLEHPDECLRMLREGLDAHGFGPDDYMLMVGSPLLISMMAAEAALRVGKLRMLQWRRRAEDYFPVEVGLAHRESVVNTGRLKGKARAINERR